MPTALHSTKIPVLLTAILIGLVVISNGILPYWGVRDYYAFFCWNLFSGSAPVHNTDIRVIANGEPQLLTDMELRSQMTYPHINRLAFLKNNRERIPDAKTQIEQILNLYNYKYVSVCNLQIPLPDFLILPPQDKQRLCNDE